MACEGSREVSREQDRLGHCYGLNCVPSKFILEALTPSVTLLGDRAFREITKIK